MIIEFTQAVADKTMKERGYNMVASAGSGAKFFYVKQTDVGPLHAEVDLKAQSVMLDFVELSYMCHLKTHPFAFDHPNFYKFEDIIYLYAQKCNDIDVFKLLEDLEVQDYSEKKKKAKKDIPERKAAFWEKIREKAKGVYDKEMCENFYRHWTEHNEDGRMMRFEKEDTFNIGGRLATWKKNEAKFNKGNKNFIEQKIEQQNKAVIIDNSKQIDTNKLF